MNDEIDMMTTLKLQYYKIHQISRKNYSNYEHRHMFSIGSIHTQAWNLVTPGTYQH